MLVIDLQDVGVRIYTFIYTMAQLPARLRPPRGEGDRLRPARIRSAVSRVEGPTLERGYESFVGLFPIPMRHGMTIGELARLFNERFALEADLEVVPMEGWSRAMYFDETGLPWVMPSPNMPTLDTAIVYPGTVLFEGTMLSEGRGTTRPFELIGAPWIDAELFAAALNRAASGTASTSGQPSSSRRFRSTPGRRAAAARFMCSTAPAFSPCTIAARAAARVLPRRIRNGSSGASRRTSTSTTKMPIDILAGSSALRQQIEGQVPLEDIIESWESGVAAFEDTRAPFLMY